MTEEEFRTLIVSKYPNHFSHCYRLHQFVQAALQGNKWFTRDHHDAAILYIRPRSFKALDSVRRLCEVALCEDAAVILRSLVNLTAVTRWIAKDPAKRAKKYLAWYWIERHKAMSERPDDFSAEDRSKIQGHFDAERASFEFVDQKGKPKFARYWYQPEANSIYDLFQQADIAEMHKDAYRPLSATEHSDVMAYVPMFENLEIVGDEKKLAMQSDSDVPGYLQTAFKCLGGILQTCDRTLPLTPGNKLKTIWNDGADFFQAYGRKKQSPT